MKFADLRNGDRFFYFGGDGMEYRKLNDTTARCIEKGWYFGYNIQIDEEDEVDYNIATENE